MTLVDKLKNLPPQWWGAVAGATAAGATVFSSHRVLGGLAVGGAMLAFALRHTQPCCADCAKASPGAVANSSSLAGADAMAGASPAVCGAGCGGLDELYS